MAELPPLTPVRLTLLITFLPEFGAACYRETWGSENKAQ